MAEQAAPERGEDGRDLLRTAERMEAADVGPFVLANMDLFLSQFHRERQAWILAEREARLARAREEVLVEAAQAMLDLEAWRMRERSTDPEATVRPCPCSGCVGLRAALASGGEGKP